MKQTVDTAKSHSYSQAGKYANNARNFQSFKGKLSSITAIAVVNTKYPALKVLDILPDTRAYLSDVKNSPSVLNKSEHLRRVRIIDEGEIKFGK